MNEKLQFAMYERKFIFSLIVMALATVGLILKVLEGVNYAQIVVGVSFAFLAAQAVAEYKINKTGT